MRVRANLLLLACFTGACASLQPTAASPSGVEHAPATPRVSAPAPAAAVPVATEHFDTDTEQTSTNGTASFIVPAGWAISRVGPAVKLTTPDGHTPIVLVEVAEPNPDLAVSEAWKQLRTDFAWPVRGAIDLPPRHGWESVRSYSYDVPPNAKLVAQAQVVRAGSKTLVALLEMQLPELEKRIAQLNVFGESLRPSGYVRESFAGKPAQLLDAARLAKLDALVELARDKLQIPGVAIAIVQGDKVIELKGFGVREFGKPALIDPDSLFLVGSNTKALTTLLLARLVDDGKLRWDTPVIEALPAFRLGSDETTAKTQIKHLVCACTGLPRQDLEWIFEYAKNTPAEIVHSLAGIEPTTKFGETYQYSNQLAAAAGYVAANVSYPGRELGAAYDRAMATRVFGPLGMRSTTFDFAKALRGDHATGHGLDPDARLVLANMPMNSAIIPSRPAGGLWSSARDMIRYVQLELDRGALPGNKRLLSEAALLERRVPQVALGEHETYGMGLTVDTTYDVSVVHHGGAVFGYKSDMLWLPDHGVGAVVLTNSDTGGSLLHPFQRALLEQLFDGKSEAADDIEAMARNRRQLMAAERAKLTIPADPSIIATLAKRYVEPKLGAIELKQTKDGSVLDAGEWQSPVATRANEDGTVSIVTIDPGLLGLPLVIGKSTGGKRQLVLRDAQHEYTFVEAEGG